MSRFSTLAAFAAVPLSLAVFVAPAAQAAPSAGNSAAAKMCQDGGFAKYQRADGTKFANEGACTSYAAKGGKLARTGPTFTAAYSGCNADLSYCDLALRGSGLLPQAPLTYCFRPGFCNTYSTAGPVASDGTVSFNREDGVFCFPGSYFTTTTASGATINTAPAICTPT